MNEAVRPSAMRRKAGEGRPPPEIGALTGPKALRIAIAQAARDVVDLTATARRVDELRTTITPFSEGIQENALILLIEGEENHFGLVVIDPQALAALIEVQTTGRVVPRPADPRPPTRTDAIMCADFVDRVLEELETRVTEAGLEVAPALSGYRFATRIEDGRTAELTLEDVPYREFRCAIDFSMGAKEGSIQFLLPHAAPGVGTGAGGGEDFVSALEAQVLETRAELSGTLHRLSVPLGAVMGLRPGDLIPVPRGAPGRVAIEDIDGNVVARGRLGQMNGHRALRLMEPEDEGAGDEDGGALAAPAPRAPAMLGHDHGAPGGFDMAASGGFDMAASGGGGLGDLGDLGGLGGGDGLAGLGDLGSGGGLGELGDLGDLGSFGDGGGLGDLGDLGDLGGLPDLESLGKL